MTNTTQSMGSALQHVGALRVAMAFIVILCALMAFFTGGEGYGWNLIPNHVAPGLVVFLAWILPFDMLMAKIFMVGGEYSNRERYRAIVWLDVLLLAILLVTWVPFFVTVLL